MTIYQSTGTRAVGFASTLHVESAIPCCRLCRFPRTVGFAFHSSCCRDDPDTRYVRVDSKRSIGGPTACYNGRFSNREPAGISGSIRSSLVPRTYFVSLGSLLSSIRHRSRVHPSPTNCLISLTQCLRPGFQRRNCTRERTNIE